VGGRGGEGYCCVQVCVASGQSSAHISKAMMCVQSCMIRDLLLRLSTHV
jgi:hypothetical protein